MICLVNTYTIWKLNDAQVKICELWTPLGGYRKVLFDTRKEALEDVGDGLGTQEIICGISNYYNVLGGFFLKGVDSMEY